MSIWSSRATQKTDNYCWHENSALKGWSNGDQSANGMAAHYVYDHTGERILKTLSLGGLATVNNSAQVIMAIESPTVYVNPYYVAIPYLQTQMVSKHYYMGSQRVASSMADVPSQIASPPASGGGEGGEEFASANLSSPDDPVIIDFISTMNCVYNASIDLAFDESLSMPELDQINFHNCEGEEFPPEELAQEDPMCLCEQSVYWGNIYGADCSSRNVMYWYHPDYLGSVEAITDVRGEVYQFFHNTIWGEPLQDQKAFTYKDFSSRFRFNGKEWDEETGNYYYGARYYDSKISVWLSVDPLAHKYPSLSPYAFVANNPVNLVDPDGRDIWRVQNGRLVLYKPTKDNYNVFQNENGTEIYRTNGEVNWNLQERSILDYQKDYKQIVGLLANDRYSQHRMKERAKETGWDDSQFCSVEEFIVNFKENAKEQKIADAIALGKDGVLTVVAPGGVPILDDAILIEKGNELINNGETIPETVSRNVQQSISNAKSFWQDFKASIISTMNNIENAVKNNQAPW